MLFPKGLFTCFFNLRWNNKYNCFNYCFIFRKKSLTIIEEPERNIHPHLISKIINMMKDASKKKQIIVTTHNPEMVKNADLEDILLVSRDKDGFSTITRPADKVEVNTFLKNEIGIEELYVQKFIVGVGLGYKRLYISILQIILLRNNLTT